MKNVVALAAAILTISWSSVAPAASSLVYINQVDRSSSRAAVTISTEEIFGPMLTAAATLAQSAPAHGSLALLEQFGDGNTGTITQSGNGHIGYIQQIGHRNHAVIQQSGSRHVGLIAQRGNDNVAILRQR